MPASHRRQYTSCDPCRKSRLGCDAATKHGGTCTNCLRRSKTCSFNWVERAKNSRQSSYVGARALETPALDILSKAASPQDAVFTGDNTWPDHQHWPAKLSHSGVEEPNTRLQQALTLHHMLWDIFTGLFEPQLGLWIGNDCNPFKRLSTAPKTLVSRLMVTLDNSSRGTVDPQTARRLGLRSIALDHQSKLEEDALINQAVISAVHAFSARWLPISHFRKTGVTGLQELTIIKESFVASIWQRAQKDVLPVLQRPSYRSILALYLFGITPTSLDNRDRTSSSLCLEASFRHYVQLRAESHIVAQRISTTHPFTGVARGNSEIAPLKAQEEYDHLADTAYWFGIVCDTSRCLTRCQSSILLPSLSSETRIWDLVRKQIESFNMNYRSMYTSKVALTDDTVLTIVQFGSSCKTLFWKAVSQVQDYFIYQTNDLPFETVMQHVIEEMERFENVFGPLLDLCARDYVLLSEKSRISYFLLSFHFHLGVLILIDTLDVHNEISQIATLFDINGARLSSTRAIFNLINLSLQADAYIGDTSTSILLRDPYPEHISNGLSRAAYSLLHLYQSMLLPIQTAEVMASSLFTGLEILNQISYTAGDSLAILRPLYMNDNLVVKRSRTAHFDQLTATTSATSESPVTPDLFEEETVRELGLASADPSLVSRTIERHEKQELPLDFTWNDLSWIDFSSVSQDWAFEDCFSSL